MCSNRSIKRIAPRSNEFISKTYSKRVKTKPFGVLDFETYTLLDGRQRAYYLLIYLPSVGYTHLRRCDYVSEEEYYEAVRDYFERYPSLYYTFNGSNFDLLLLNRILSLSSYLPRIYTDGTAIRRLKWKGSIFQDILRWIPPSTLSDMAKTWLGKDLKDVFPYDAVKEDMILSKDSRFGTIAYNHFSYKVKVYPEDIKRFSEGNFWNLSGQYVLKDVNITYDSIIEIEKLYNTMGYSVTDEAYSGIASIAYDHSLRYIEGDEFALYDKGLYDRWKDCYLGGIVELVDLNTGKEKVYVYDINGLYTFVRLKYSYPIGVPQEISNPTISELNGLFGLIKAVVYNDGKVLLGIPYKTGSEFNRVKGRVLYRGTTEELKNLVRLGAVVERIESVLHYPRRREGKSLWGESIGEWENIKREGK